MASCWENKWLCALAIAFIFFLGASVRFHEIQSRGPSFFDEGIYILEGKWVYTASASLWRALLRKIEEARSGKNLYTFDEEARRIRGEIQGQPPVWGRPAFSLLVALCMAVIGPKPYAAHAVSAFFGSLSILVIFLVARSIFSNGTALLAAFLLAVSGYHYIYSVTGLADGPAMFFALCAFFFYVKSRAQPEPLSPVRWMVLTGLLCGISFTVHDRCFYVLLIVMTCEAFDFFLMKRRVGEALKRGILLCSTFFLPLVLFELPYYIGMVVLRHFNKPLPFRTYFEELLTHHSLYVLHLMPSTALSMLKDSAFPEIQDAGSRLYNFLTYPYLFSRFDGPLFLVVFLVGLAAVLRSRTRTERLLLVWFFVPFVLFSISISASVRYALVFLPAVMIMAARAIPLIVRWARGLPLIGRVREPIVLVCLVAAIVLSNLLVSTDLRRLRCSYEEPARFLREHGRKHISTEYPVSRVYLGYRNVKEPPYTWEQLEDNYRQGYRYYLTDFRKLSFKPPFDKTERGAIINEIETRLAPVFTYVHPCYSAPCYIFEANLFFKLTLRIVREAHERGFDVIRIYDLKDLYEPGDD